MEGKREPCPHEDTDELRCAHGAVTRRNGEREQLGHRVRPALERRDEPPIFVRMGTPHGAVGAGELDEVRRQSDKSQLQVTEQSILARLRDAACAANEYVEAQPMTRGPVRQRFAQLRSGYFGEPRPLMSRSRKHWSGSAANPRSRRMSASPNLARARHRCAMSVSSAQAKTRAPDRARHILPAPRVSTASGRPGDSLESPSIGQAFDRCERVANGQIAAAR